LRADNGFHGRSREACFVDGLALLIARVRL
jgi:hypothetical protein